MARHFLNFPAVYRWGTKWIGRFPTFLTYGMSQGLADISFLFYRSAVSSVRENLRLVFPSLSEGEISSIARRMFRNYSKYLVDYGRFASFDERAKACLFVSYDGKENLEKALDMRKGLILVTAHLGNWELGGILFEGYGMRANVITLPDEDPEIDGIRRWYRDRHGVKTITIGHSPLAMLEMLNALKNNEVIAMLIDRYTLKLEAMETEFFNKPAIFPRGPFILSRMTGAPIIAAFVVREKSGYKGIVRGPFVVVREEDEREALEKITGILENYIKIYPDQWYNFRKI